MSCPFCGGTDLSVNLVGYLVDGYEGQPDAPLLCEGCGWQGTEDEE